MNPIVILTKNNLEMNKRCVSSALAQDIPTTVHIYDNESTDGTKEWVEQLSNTDSRVVNQSSGVDLGVSEGWNFVLDNLFSQWKALNALVINSDTFLPPWMLSSLISYDAQFVTGVSVGSMEEIATPPPRKELIPHPDMSAFLIRKDCWDTVGEFDGNMVLYASDLDYHIRAHFAGVRLMNAGVPFFHERSSTLNNASPLEKNAIRLQADADRTVFRNKWRVPALGGGGYDALFDESNFGLRNKVAESMREHNTL